MRKMRLHKREIHDPSLIKDILDECDVVRLGLHDEEGMFIVPVNYGYELKDNNGNQKITKSGSGKQTRYFS